MNSRRIFIKNTLGSLAAVTFACNDLTSVAVPKQPKKLGVALVGLGYYSTDLLAPASPFTPVTIEIPFHLG